MGADEAGSGQQPGGQAGTPPRLVVMLGRSEPVPARSSPSPLPGRSPAPRCRSTTPTAAAARRTSASSDRRRPGKTKTFIQNGRWYDNPVPGLSSPGFSGPGPIACHQLTELALPTAMIPAPRAVGHHRCAEDGPGQPARVLVPNAAGSRHPAGNHLRVPADPSCVPAAPPASEVRGRRPRCRHGHRPNHSRNPRHHRRDPGGDSRCPRPNPDHSQSPRRRRSRPPSASGSSTAEVPAHVPASRHQSAIRGNPRLPGLNAVSRDLRPCPGASTRGVWRKKDVRAR